MSTMSTIINSISIDYEVVVKNIMGATAIIGFVVMIMMLIASTICTMRDGWTSPESSTCAAIAFCAGLMMYFACNYISMH